MARKRVGIRISRNLSPSQGSIDGSLPRLISIVEVTIFGRHLLCCTIGRKNYFYILPLFDSLWTREPTQRAPIRVSPFNGPERGGSTCEETGNKLVAAFSISAQSYISPALSFTISVSAHPFSALNMIEKVYHLLIFYLTALYLNNSGVSFNIHLQTRLHASQPSRR